jgi:hypothetical protein
VLNLRICGGGGGADARHLSSHARRAATKPGLGLMQGLRRLTRAYACSYDIPRL